MYLSLKLGWKAFYFLLGVTIILSGLFILGPGLVSAQEESKYIKWVDFTPTTTVMQKAMELDIAAHHDGGTGANFVELLAYLAVKYGGDFSHYQSSHLLQIAERINEGESMDEIMSHNKYYAYYKEAYGAAVGSFIGEYIRQKPDPENSDRLITETGYGLRAFSPIAAGYSYSHYDDFGNNRSYGFRRKHLGNDLIASVGTPIIAVEGGRVEAAGWNRYGGWRVGIRSHDGMRYYYYAHLRKGHPFAPGIQEGAIVEAGQVIGYLGMTGYSTTENVNGMTIPHLHFGLQLIFDESQKEGNNEIWIDVYHIVSLLEGRKSTVTRLEGTKDFVRKYSFVPLE